jgi:hypothetical protein
MSPAVQRAVHGLAALVGVVLVLRAVAWAYGQAFQADGLPLWDSAGYLLEAEKLRARVAALDGRGVVSSLSHPDLHPPLHSALLGAWMLVAGNDLASARLYPLVGFVAALACLPVLGHLAFGRGGALAGVGAALVMAHAKGNLELIATPMTEATAVAATFGALALATHLRDRSDGGARLSVGCAILAATLVRWNLGPMLVAPLLLDHAVRHRRDRTRLLDARIVGWVLPTAVTLAAWQLLRPELYENIRKFLENRSSGLPTWSWENLGFVVISAQHDYLGSWVLVALLFGLAVAGAGAPDRAGIVRAYAAISVGLLTWHDFKIGRNLASVLPVIVLLGMGATGHLASRLPAGVRAASALLGVLALGLGWGEWQRRGLLADLPRKVDFQPDPAVRKALDFVTAHARDGGQAFARTWVTGWVFRISPPLLEWWFRVEELPGKLLLDQQHFGTQSRTGADSAWNEQYADQVRDVMLAEAARKETTYITIETTPGSRYWDAWKAFGNNYARAMGEQDLVPEIDRLELFDDGLTLRAYRLGGTPSASTTAAMDTGPRPEDDLGVVLPEGVEPLFRDTLSGGARRWKVYPEEAKRSVEIDRGGGALTLRVISPEPRLMACDTIQDAPAVPFRAVVNLSATGLRGKAFLHVRGMGRDDALQQIPGAGWDITQGGPLVEGGQVLDRPVTLGPTSPRARVCLALDNVTGTVSLLDAAFVPRDAPEVGTAGPGAADGASAGAGASRGWSLFPPSAAAMLAPRGASGVSVLVGEPVAQLQACAETWPVARPPAKVMVRARARGATGKGWLHVRALGADGVLLRKPEGGGHIEQFGPLTGDAVVEGDRALRFPPETAMVRACVVLDGVSGEVVVERVEMGE